jgi:hypothetical protein
MITAVCEQSGVMHPQPDKKDVGQRAFSGICVDQEVEIFSDGYPER